MIRTICKAVTVAAGLAAIASVAMAGVPDPSKSTTDGGFMVGNARGGLVLNVPGMPANALNGYDVTVRDVGNVPLAGVTVSFNYPSGTLRTMSTQQFGQTANCTSNTVSAVTDGSGHAAIIPAVVGRNENGTGSPTIQVRANGVLLTTITLHSFDMVCSSGSTGVVDLADFNMFRQHYNPAQPFTGQPAGDFSGNNVVDLTDLNLFRTEYNCGQEAALPAGSICTRTQCSPCP